MRITQEGKVGIWLGLIGIIGTGATVVAPWLGWTCIGVAAAGIALMLFYHLCDWLGHEWKIGHKQQMIALAGMLSCGLGFLVFLGLYFWYRVSAANPVLFDASVSTLSDDERFQRRVILDDITNDYLKDNPTADPKIFAGIQDPPSDYVNRRLDQKSIQWRVKDEILIDSTEQLYVECKWTTSPIKIPEEGRINVLSLWNTPLVNRGGGLGSLGAKPGSDLDLGNKYNWASRCRIINYGSKALFQVVIGLDVSFISKIKLEGANSVKSGDLISKRPWGIFIDRIEPGNENAYVFYIRNYTDFFVNVSFPGTGKAKLIGDDSNYLIHIASSNSTPLMFSPVFEKQE